MEEIIVIRATDPDGSMFQTIMDALRGRRAEVIEMTAPSHDILTFGDIEIHPDRRTVLKAGEEVRLNHGEFSMLLLLASAPGQVFSKDQLYACVNGEPAAGGASSVMVHISNIRAKLEDDPLRPRFIKTVRGLGYRLDG